MVACEGNDALAIELLLRAEAEFEGAEMALHAAVSRHRRGELSGGDEGRRLVEDALAYLDAQGVEEPARFLWMLAPFGAPMP